MSQVAISARREVKPVRDERVTRACVVEPWMKLGTSGGRGDRRFIGRSILSELKGQQGRQWSGAVGQKSRR